MPEPKPPAPADSALPGDVFALPAAEGAAVVVRRLIAEVAERRLRLSDEKDAEALHDFRVALRRLRSWLRAFRPELDRTIPRKARRRLRGIAQASNESRDGEVQLAWLREQASVVSPETRPGLDWLVDRLETRKQIADERFRERLTGDFERARAALDEALSAAPGDSNDRTVLAVRDTFAAAVASVFRSQVERLRLNLSAVRSVDDDEVAHRARIAGKRLRYVLDPVAESIAGGEHILPRLKAMQDALGELHDVHVLIESVANALAAISTERSQRVVAAVRAVGSGTQRFLDRSGVDVEVGLVAIAVRLHERAVSAFYEVRDSWLDEPGQSLLADISALAANLKTPSGNRGLEIERKYCLRGLPEQVRGVTPVEIKQGYLPGERLVERVRHVRVDGTERCLRTVKLGEGLIRTEVEEETTPEVFAAMWPLTEGRRIRKRRYAIVDASLTWEIDEFLDRDLVLAEVELPGAEEAVEPPAWLAPLILREVTDEPEFKNENLAR